MICTGARDRCPFCRTALAAGDEALVAEHRCPRCEAELWVLALPSGPAFFTRRPVQSADEFLAALAGAALGLSAEEIDSFLRAADWLDTVEFAEELERVLRLPSD